MTSREFWESLNSNRIDSALCMQPEEPRCWLLHFCVMTQVFDGTFPSEDVHGAGFCVVHGLERPASRGTIRLKSGNPFDTPVIDPNYLDKDMDVENLLFGNCFSGRAPKSGRPYRVTSASLWSCRTLPLGGPLASPGGRVSLWGGVVQPRGGVSPEGGQPVSVGIIPEGGSA